MLVITNSAFIGNRASPLLGGTGGISNRASSVEVTNTTFTQNGPETIGNTGHFLLTNTTFADSLETPVSSATTITSFGDAAVMILANTILVHAPDQTHTVDCRGRITSVGNNIISDVTTCDVSFQPGDRTGDAGLAAFTDDGVPGHPHYPLLPTSQAVNTGNDSVCPKRDQIGTPRRHGCDIGAIEFTGKK